MDPGVFGTADPYVTLALAGIKFQSRGVRNSLNPDFGQVPGRSPRCEPSLAAAASQQQRVGSSLHAWAAAGASTALWGRWERAAETRERLFGLGRGWRVREVNEAEGPQKVDGGCAGARPVVRRSTV